MFRFTFVVPILTVCLLTSANGQTGKAKKSQKTEKAEKASPWLEGWGEAKDPLGDCKVDLEKDKVTIKIPGKPHDLSAEINLVNAPTVLGEVEGDFIAEVNVTGPVRPGGRALTPPRLPFNGAGLLVWQDEKNYLRLERASIIREGQAASYVNFELRKDGKMANSRGGAIPDQDTGLRIERRGDQIRAWVGLGADRWAPLPPMTIDFPQKVKVGVSAGNTASEPFTATLEKFMVFQRLERAKP